MARAKRTDRTEARRRYRAEQAALVAASTDDADDVDGDATPRSTAARPAAVQKSAPAAPAGPRPSITAAFRGAYRPVDLRGDLRAIPRIVIHWGFLASVGAAVAATAVFILTTNDFASSLDMSLSNPLAGQSISTVSNLSYLVVSLFVAPPPAAGAFLVGFTAARASWLAGLLYGLVAAACYSVILLSPTGRLFIGANAPGPYIMNAWVVAPLGATLFAAASAWYKRFLNAVNPNRARQQRQQQKPQGRGNARPNSRASSRP